MDIAGGIRKALAYIEANLDGELSVEEIASKAYLSAYHFQRVFAAMCGHTVGEYVRARRLSLAAIELKSGGAKVIDVAMKYGYSSPDGFARAFAKFHGVLPSAVDASAELRYFEPLDPAKLLKGESDMEFRIVHKAAFTVVGMKRRFSSETSYQEIPAWWDEVMADEKRPIAGEFGVCLDLDGVIFDYLIADSYRQGIPEGCEKVSFEEGDWAVFPCRMSTLQDTNTRMWSEWLPSQREYRLRANCNIEMYSPSDRCELWLPVEKVG